MWQALAGIIVIVCAAALISVVVGLIIGIARKRWKALKYSSIVFGVSIALLVTVAALGSAFDDSETTSAQTTTATLTHTPRPTFTPEAIVAAQTSSSATTAAIVDTPASTNTPLTTNTPASTATPEPTATATPTETPVPPTSTSTPTPTFEDLKQIADRVPWEELYRNNETYIGDLVYLEGKVVQVIADGNSDRYRIRVAVNETDEVVYVHYRGSERLLQDDIVEVIGNVEGLYTYQSVSSGPITIPEITDSKIRRVSVTANSAQSITPTPTHTPHPTHTPEPTAAPTLVPTSTPEPTATPIPIGASEDNPIPYREKGLLANTDNFYLRVVSVFQGKRADALFSNAPELDTDFTRVVVRIKVQNDGMRADNYNATRIRAFGLKSKQSYTEWWRPDDSNYCGHWLEASWDHYEDIAPGSAQTGNICFVVPKFDAGALLLVDNGGYRASYEDWRYWKLRE